MDTFRWVFVEACDIFFYFTLTYVKLQFSAFYLSKCFCLEYAEYKNPSKEYCHSFNYAVHETILCSTLIGY